MAISSMPLVGLSKNRTRRLNHLLHQKSKTVPLLFPKHLVFPPCICQPLLVHQGLKISFAEAYFSHLLRPLANHQLSKHIYFSQRFSLGLLRNNKSNPTVPWKFWTNFSKTSRLTN